jgi:iron-sulfur cluster assembly protein
MLNLTQKAVSKIQQQLQRRGQGLGVRIGVKTTGCSGLAYILEYVDEEISTDEKIENSGFNVYVDPKASVYIKGMTVDYVRNGLNEGFDFQNPNERDRCGCGSSFRV